MRAAPSSSGPRRLGLRAVAFVSITVMAFSVLFSHPWGRYAGDGGMPLRGYSPERSEKTWVIPPKSRSDELVLVGVCGRGGARGDVELHEDVADVAVDGLVAEAELS